MDELITWLRKQLDEDERVAREAGDDCMRWRFEGPERILVDDYRTLAVAPYEGDLHEAEHISRWDPARGCAEVEAKRQMLDFLDPTDAPEGEGKYVAERAIVLLAQPYAGQPGWREEWRI